MPVLPSYRNQQIDWFLYEETLAFNGLIKVAVEECKTASSISIETRKHL